MAWNLGGYSQGYDPAYLQAAVYGQGLTGYGGMDYATPNPVYSPAAYYTYSVPGAPMMGVPMNVPMSLPMTTDFMNGVPGVPMGTDFTAMGGVSGVGMSGNGFGPDFSVPAQAVDPNLTPFERMYGKSKTMPEPEPEPEPAIGEGFDEFDSFSTPNSPLTAFSAMSVGDAPGQPIAGTSAYGGFCGDNSSSYMTPSPTATAVSTASPDPISHLFGSYSPSPLIPDMNSAFGSAGASADVGSTAPTYGSYGAPADLSSSSPAFGAYGAPTDLISSQPAFRAYGATTDQSSTSSFGAFSSPADQTQNLSPYGTSSGLSSPYMTGSSTLGFALAPVDANTSFGAPLGYDATASAAPAFVHGADGSLMASYMPAASSGADSLFRGFNASSSRVASPLSVDPNSTPTAFDPTTVFATPGAACTESATTDSFGLDTSAASPFEIGTGFDNTATTSTRFDGSATVGFGTSYDSMPASCDPTETPTHLGYDQSVSGFAVPNRGYDPTAYSAYFAAYGGATQPTSPYGTAAQPADADVDDFGDFEGAGSASPVTGLDPSVDPYGLTPSPLDSFQNPSYFGTRPDGLSDPQASSIGDFGVVSASAPSLEQWGPLGSSVVSTAVTATENPLPSIDFGTSNEFTSTPEFGEESSSVVEGDNFGLPTFNQAMASDFVAMTEPVASAGWEVGASENNFGSFAHQDVAFALAPVPWNPEGFNEFGSSFATPSGDLSSTPVWVPDTSNFESTTPTATGAGLDGPGFAPQDPAAAWPAANFSSENSFGASVGPPYMTGSFVSPTTVLVPQDDWRGEDFDDFEVATAGAADGLDDDFGDFSSPAGADAGFADPFSSPVAEAMTPVDFRMLAPSATVVVTPESAKPTEPPQYDFDHPTYDPMLYQDQSTKEKLTEEDIEDMMVKTFRVTFGSTVVQPQKVEHRVSQVGFFGAPTPTQPAVSSMAEPASAPTAKWDDLSLLFSTTSTKKVDAKKADNSAFLIRNWDLVLTQCQEELSKGIAFLCTIEDSLLTVPEESIAEVLSKLFSNPQLVEYFKGLAIVKSIISKIHFSIIANISNDTGDKSRLSFLTQQALQIWEEKIYNHLARYNQSELASEDIEATGNPELDSEQRCALTLCAVSEEKKHVWEGKNYDKDCIAFWYHKVSQSPPE